MRRRKPFFIKGNFQLKFLLCYAAVVVLGTSLAAFFVYQSLRQVVEEAAFSSHLSFASSGELFRQHILQVNLWAAGASVLAAVLLVLWVHIYLENFFRYLTGGLDHLAQGRFSFRLKTKNQWLVRPLLDDFNSTAKVLEKDRRHLEALVSNLVDLVDSPEPKLPGKIKELHARLNQYFSSF